MSGRSKDREAMDALFDTDEYQVNKLTKRIGKVVKVKRGKGRNDSNRPKSQY